MWYLTFTCSKSLSDPSSSMWQCWYWGNSDAWLDLMTFPAWSAQLDVLVLLLWSFETGWCELILGMQFSLGWTRLVWAGWLGMVFNFLWTVGNVKCKILLRHTAKILLFMDSNNVSCFNCSRQTSNYCKNSHKWGFNFLWTANWCCRIVLFETSILSLGAILKQKGFAEAFEQFCSTILVLTFHE